MSNVIQRVKGMYDLLPAQTPTWQWVESTCNEILASCGYQEIRLPLLEKSELFSRAIGASTDVVSKEMYAFEDRNGDWLALRPEGTAGCVRAAVANGLLQGHCAKLRYAGPMFRRENVQRGRNRQFYQIGAEAFGLEGPDVDAELVLSLARIFERLGLRDLRLEINSLGVPESRARHREQLVSYLERHRDQLDEDSLRRLSQNPLRILDSKNPDLKDLIDGAPSLLDHLDEPSRDHFETFQAILTDAGLAFTVNPRLVRGLDYYTRTVFEWITDDLGSQGTVCGGGRYDGLVALQGGPECPAVGYSIGVDRLVELVTVQEIQVPGTEPHVYLILAGDGPRRKGLLLADTWREAVPGLRVETNLGGGSFKAQFKRADRSGAAVALVLGDSELAAGTVAWKPLREDAPQAEVTLDALLSRLSSLVEESGPD